jgi:hypothetical protein
VKRNAVNHLVKKILKCYFKNELKNNSGNSLIRYLESAKCPDAHG